MVAIVFGAFWLMFLINDGGWSLFSCKVFTIFREEPFGSKITFFNIVMNDGWEDEFFEVLLSVSLLFIGFSKEIDDDENINKIRFKALVWAMFVNTLLVILTTLFVYSIAYVYMMYVNSFLALLLYVIKYKYDLYQFRKKK